jgi:hypothetical protein
MMQKKFLNTLIALIVLGGTYGAFTYYDKHKSKEKPPAETTSTAKILPVDAQQIQSITFKPRDGDAFTCKREDGKWTISDPRPLPVDQGNFSGVLNSLTSAAIAQVVDQHPASLKDFGLDPPAYTLEITTSSNPQSLTLSLGDDTPTSDGLYGQLGGNPEVFTLDTFVKSSLEKKLFDLRDRRALTLDAEQLQQISVQSKGSSWTLEKNPEGVWDLSLPPAVRADSFAVDGLVSQLRGLTMQAITSEDKKKSGDYGLASPDLRIELKGSGGTQTIVVGKKETNTENHYATNSALDPVFTLSSEFVNGFHKTQADLREKDLFSFSAFDVKKVELDTPAGHFAFERQGEKWKETAPKTKSVDSDKMDTFLNHLRDLRANSFPAGTNMAEFGLAQPPYRFKVQFGDKNTVEIVEAAKKGDKVYARRATDPLASEVSGTALDDLDKQLAGI